MNLQYWATPEPGHQTQYQTRWIYYTGTPVLAAAVDHHDCEARPLNTPSKPTGESAGAGTMVDADSLKYSDLNEDDTDAVMAFMAVHFYPREPLSTGLHMTYEDNKEWIHHSAEEWVRSGVCVVARDPDTGKIGGTLLGTILTRDQTNTYQKALTSPKTKVKTLHTVLSVLEAAVDFFERYEKVDRILEIAMLTVSAEIAGRGVGRRLVQESEQRGRRLGCQLATAQATAVPSQRLLYRLGYESLYTMDYTTFEIAGDRVFDIDRMLGTPSAKVMARVLEPYEENGEKQEGTTPPGNEENGEKQEGTTPPGNEENGEKQEGTTPPGEPKE